MIPPETALQIVLEKARPLDPCRIPLQDALGSCLAEEVRADRDSPPADRSAMDGFAVRSGDLSDAPTTLPLRGECAAGAAESLSVKAGTCVRIFTGANIPEGADAVVMVEETEEAGDGIAFRSPVRPGRHIRRKGENARKGEMLLRPGMRLDAMRIGVCAAVGVSEPLVHRRPRVAILSTGRELRSAGDLVGDHQIRDSNGPVLEASLRAWGLPGAALRNAPDDLEVISRELKAMAAENDVVVLSGGVSKGKYDFVPDAVKRVGGEVHFHRVSMKPGKPVLYAAVGAVHVFGLPGNPLSVITGFCQFVLPALQRLSGLDRGECRPSLHVPLASEVTYKGGRTGFLQPRMLRRTEGPCVEPVRSRGSGDLVSGGRADGSIIVPAGTHTIAAGTSVEFLPWRPLP
ncbi:MAG: molybdopterin molybdotransferase MoeA [Planctomycetota bacterium]